ncbi:helix-turn-helix transcriptional regulator [Halosolutus gelatinilyticus]|uniref:helix-turn-helix transcriptional regulator n=1 Tax=Halosolutus gelatinilyticus TaxID=2931975 RepID=UPI001FF17F24|nr:transcriptional regulator [Halosolutus gelatinilyticus]
MTQDLLDELFQYELSLGRDRYRRDPDAAPDAEELLDVVRHGELFRALLAGPLDRREIEERLDVSRATSHRFVRWLEEHGYGERVDNRYQLTGFGATIAYGVCKFETYLGTARRLEPLFEYICEDHEEFVVEPFVDATVTIATPADPYAPIERFLSLLRESETFRGFNTTHMIPPGADAADDPLFTGRTVELVYVPDTVETLRNDSDAALEAAIDEGTVTIRARDALPYGLALFDDRVGIGGYDEETGAMCVFVDADAAIAREWATRVFDSIRADSRPVSA